MQKLVYCAGLFAATVLCCVDSASAQPIGEPEPLPNTSNAKPPFKWDYRFDAQYNSTIKPYLRWYNRKEYRTPQYGVRYPYYLAPQPFFGGDGSSACGQATGYVPPRQSKWFNPYQYLNQRGQPQRPASNRPGSGGGVHHGILRHLSDSKSTGRAKITRQAPRKTKTAWVKHESETNSVSVLFFEPAESVQDGFVQASVTTIKGKLAVVRWIDQPSEQLTSVLSKYVD